MAPPETAHKSMKPEPNPEATETAQTTDSPAVVHERLVRPLTADEKLKLIEEPARRAISQLRILADDNTLGICDEGQCSMSNLALWLEGVLDENPGYMPWCSETARVKLGWPNTEWSDRRTNPKI